MDLHVLPRGTVGDAILESQSGDLLFEPGPDDALDVSELDLIASRSSQSGFELVNLRRE
jgi:hypothetical protein